MDWGLSIVWCCEGYRESGWYGRTEYLQWFVASCQLGAELE